MEKRQFHFRRVVKLSVSSVVGRKEEGTATETRRWTRCLGEKKSKRVDTLGMEVGWGGSRGSDMCRGLRQEGAFATVCAKENSEEGTDSRVAR